MTRQGKIAAEALMASVRFSAEIVSVVNLASMPGLLSALNASSTAIQMRQHIADMARFVDWLEAQS